MTGDSGVDRFFALWQAGNREIDPSLWIKPVADEKIPLTPFYHSNGNMWTSADVRDIKNLGYDYDVLAGVSDRATMLGRVAQAYGKDRTRNPRNVPIDVIAYARFEA